MRTSPNFLASRYGHGQSRSANIASSRSMLEYQGTALCTEVELHTSNTLHVSLMLLTWTRCRKNPGSVGEVRRKFNCGWADEGEA